MKKGIMQERETILSEHLVTSNKYKGDLKIELTTEKIIIKKKKGLFKKVYKEIDEILLKDIKVYNDDVLVKNKKCFVEIETHEKNVSFKFMNSGDAKKFANKVIDILTGTSFIKRVSNKIKKVVNAVDDVIGKENRNNLLKTLGTGIVALIVHFRNKK